MKNWFETWTKKLGATMPFFLLALGLLLEEVVGKINIEGWVIWAAIVLSILIWSIPYEAVTKNARFKSNIKYLENLATYLSDDSLDIAFKRISVSRIKFFCEKYDIPYPDEDDYTDSMNFERVWSLFLSTLVFVAEHGNLDLAKGISKTMKDRYKKRVKTSRDESD
ncbi:MAG: hypothetical protein OXG15_03280 [Gammaproteobacteria bacterium]|nr:hypothetical protein [Gammaproteobacteria bacterium]